MASCAIKCLTLAAVYRWSESMNKPASFTIAASWRRPSEAVYLIFSEPGYCHFMIGMIEYIEYIANIPSNKLIFSSLTIVRT